MQFAPRHLRLEVILSLAICGLAAAAAPPARPQPPRAPWQPPVVLLDAPVGLTAAGGTWAFAHGGNNEDYASVARQTADSGFVLSGSTASVGAGLGELWLKKVDSAGTRVWEKTYGTAAGEYGSIFGTADGGYFLIATSADPNTSLPVSFTIGKLDANGVVTWQKKLRKSGADTTDLTSVQPLSGGGYLITGTVFDFSSFPPSYKNVTIKIDSGGTILWQKQEDAGAYPFFGFAFEQADGTFLAVGSGFPDPDNTDNTDGRIRKLSSTGTVLWDKYYGGPQADSLGSVVPANGGGFLAIGTSKSWGSGGDTTGDIWLVKFDGTNGNVTAQKVLGGTGDEYAGVVALADGYLLSGLTKSTGTGAGDIFVMKLDNNLNVVWAKYYSIDTDTDDFGYAFLDTVVGGYLLIGSTHGTGRGLDIVGAKLDTNGNVSWARAYGGNGDDSGFIFRAGALAAFATSAEEAALAASDLVLSGSTESYGSGATDALIAQLDSNGQIAGCPFVLDLTLSGVNWTVPTAATTATVTTNTPTITDITSYSTVAGTLVTTTVTTTATNVCTATQLLSATASADKTSGVAPLTVAFTGTATGGTGPYTYSWDFGDGSADSTQQNPGHTYNSAGSYPVTLTVKDSTNATATDTHLTITVTAAACTLTCSTTVPTTGTAGQSVAFTSTYSSSNCSDPVTFSWTFGDAQTSTQQNPSHTYAAAGTYNWTYTVSRGATSCSKNGSITISGGATQYVYWVPSAAHAPGALGSKWRSDIAVVNRSGSTATLTLLFVPYSSGSTITKSQSLANNNTAEWDDVLVSLFGFADSANTKGTVKITSNVPLTALSRTYNQAASGTFGQYYPALTDAQGISGSQAAVLPLLRKNASFRTNAGFQNLTGASCTGEIKLFNAAGAQVGSTRTLTAAADKYIQEDDIFTKAGAGTQDVAYARVQATTAGCKAWFYGSVIDGITNDPTTVPQQSSTAGPYWIPSAAHAPGALGSKWRSDIAVVNRSGGTANLTLVFVPYSSGSTVTKTQAVANNRTVAWDDVLVSLFGFADSANTKGTIKITSDRSIFALSRTYNQAASGTFGQYYPLLTAAQAISNGQPAILPLLRKSADFRTNGAFQNLGTASCTGTIKLFNAAGAQVGSTRTLTAATDKYIQEDDIFTKAAAGNQKPAYAVVDVSTSGGKAWFFASVIDGITNDPTTVPQQR